MVEREPDGSHRSRRTVLTSTERPTWSTWREAVAVVVYRPHLRKTVRVALVVGTVIFTINQLDVVLAGDATVVTYVKAAVTYLVPLAVSNYGILLATHTPVRKEQR